MNRREFEIMYRREDTYWWYVGMRKIARSFAPDVFALGPSARLLDVGCGTGANLSAAGAEGMRAMGIDVSLDALFFSRERGLGGLSAGGADALPFRDGSFDAVTFHDALGGVERDERALSECFRVCRSGGILYVTAAALESLGGEHDAATGVEHRYGKRELVGKVERAGFVIERVSFANALLLAPIFAARRLRRLVGRRNGKRGATSDFHLVPGSLDGFLKGVLSLEGRLLRHVSLPLGVTLLVKARRLAP